MRAGDNKQPGFVLPGTLQEYSFPAKLDEKESGEMVHRLEFGLKDIGDFAEKNFEFSLSK